MGSAKKQGCVLNGKGSKRRPALVAEKVVEANWAFVFGSTKLESAARAPRRGSRADFLDWLMDDRLKTEPSVAVDDRKGYRPLEERFR